uniref:Uncharacterized protein n=1 Tax=Arundo donax TaxID=35708 RepID=A0A0A9EIW1_ARUDO
MIQLIHRANGGYC